MILVTGASGLIGSHVILALLRKGHNNIRCIGRSPESARKFETIANYYPDTDTAKCAPIEWACGSITDPVFVQSVFTDVTTVYHCAAEVSFNPAEREQMFETNIYGTECIVNAALLAGVEQFCHVSSIAAIGGNDQTQLRTEQCEWDAGQYRSNYSWSKYYAEMEVWRGIAEGLPATIVNPSVVIGPGNWGQSSSAFFTKVWNGMRFYTDGGTGFVDVRDVADTMIRLVTEQKWGERYILNAENANYFRLISEIDAALNKQNRLTNIPPALASIAWRFERIRSAITGKGPRITKETIRTSFGHSHYSNHKITETAGIKFIPLSESIKHTAAVFLQNQP